MHDLSNCVVIDIGMENARGMMWLGSSSYQLPASSDIPISTSVVQEDGRLAFCKGTDSELFGSYIRGFTQLLGRSYREYQNLHLDRDMFGCPVVEQNRKPVFDLHGTKVSPVDATAEVIKTVMNMAKSRVETVDSVVLIIPDDFRGSQKEAAMEAIALAGYKCLFLLPESLASVMESIDVSVSTPQVFLVYNFGGSSFKADLVQYKDGILQHLQHQQFSSIGGLYFDQMLANKVLSDVPDIEVEIDSNDYFVAMKRLRHVCKIAKESCDVDGEINIDLSEYGIEDMMISITCDEVKMMFGNEVKKTISVVDDMIRQQYKRLDVDSINKVVMVGGTSLLPIVNEAIRNRFPGRVISNNPAYRAVSGGFHYLRTMDQSDSHIRLALGRKIGLAVTEKKVHSLFNEDSVPLRVTNFKIELRGPSETKFKSALYEILSSSNSKVYELSDCQLIRFITYNLSRGQSSDRYKVSFTLKDINTIRFQCKNAETGEVVVSEEDLIVFSVCCAM